MITSYQRKQPSKLPSSFTKRKATVSASDINSYIEASSTEMGRRLVRFHYSLQNLILPYSLDQFWTSQSSLKNSFVWFSARKQRAAYLAQIHRICSTWDHVSSFDLDSMVVWLVSQGIWLSNCIRKERSFFSSIKENNYKAHIQYIAKETQQE